MDLDIQYFHNDTEQEKPMSDNEYSNFLPILAIGGSALINKKQAKKKDAQSKLRIAQINKEAALKRLAEVKEYEAKRKAEEDLKKASAEEDKAKQEVVKADEDLQKATYEPSSTDKKKKLIYVGIGVGVLLGLYLILRKK
jgi:rRNA maturation endonuclease Nob1